MIVPTSQSLKDLMKTDYHCVYVFSSSLREYLKTESDLTKVNEYAQWFWKEYFEEQCLVEEQFFALHLSEDLPDFKKILAQHRRLKRLFTSPKNLFKALNRIEEELDAHLKFEERTLKFWLKDKTIRMKNHVDWHDFESINREYFQKKRKISP